MAHRDRLARRVNLDRLVSEAREVSRASQELAALTAHQAKEVLLDQLG